jgi:hypothetical protein
MIELALRDVGLLGLMIFAGNVVVLMLDGPKRYWWSWQYEPREHAISHLTALPVLWYLYARIGWTIVSEWWRRR